MRTGVGAGPTRVSDGGNSSDALTSTGDFAPSMVLAMPTGNSNSSPGATWVGTVGVSTKSPRTVVEVSAMPMRLAVTATALMRTRPLK